MSTHRLGLFTRNVFTSFRRAVIGMLALATVLVAPAPAFAAIGTGTGTAWVETFNAAGAASTTIVIDRPSGVVSGDFMVAAINYQGGSGTTISGVPSGWTLIERTDSSTDFGLATYYKVAGGSEAATYTWTFSTAQRTTGGIVRYTGVASVSPIDVQAEATGNDTAPTAPTVTTTLANDLVIAVFAEGATNGQTPENFNTPSGMTERYDITRDTGGGVEMSSALFDVAQAVAGASGTKVSGNGTADAWVTQTIALKEGPDVTAPTVSSVTSSTANGSYNDVDPDVSIQVLFSENVIVTGVPQLTLETGATDRTANYTSGTGTSTLTFTYDIQVGDTSGDLNYVGTSSLALNSGTIKDAADNNATLTLPSTGSGNSLGGSKAIVIDTTAPTVTEDTAVPSPTEDTTPSYTFNTTEAGTIAYGGTCSAADTTASSGDNTQTFNTLGAGTYNDCTITVTDAAGNTSAPLSVNTFTIDLTVPQFVSTSSAANANTGATTLVITAPSSIVAGNLLVAAVIYNTGTSVTVTEPSGWTLIDTVNSTTAVGMKTYYKVATGSEPGSYSWGLSPSVHAAGGIIQYSGAATVSPVDVFVTNSQASGTDVTASSVTTTQNNDRVIYFFGKDDGTTFNNPSGLNDRFDVRNTVGAGPSVSAGDLAKFALGSSGAFTATIASSSDSAIRVAQTVAIKKTSVDSTAPTFVVNDGAAAGPVQTDTINVTASDETSLNAGSLEYAFSADATCNASDFPGTGFTNSTNFSVTGDHADYLCVKAVDTATNVGYHLVGQLNTDNTAPTFTVNESVDAGPVASDTINVTVNGGSATRFYGFSADATCNASDDAGLTNAFTSAVDFSITGTHTDYLCVKATDTAGNVGYHLVGQLNTLNADVTAPTFVVNDGAAAGPVQTDTINVTASDETSLNAGSLEYAFSADATCNASDFPGTGFTNSADFSVTGDHTDYLCVKAVDTATNVGYHLVGQLNTDNTAPTGPTGVTSPSHTLSTWSNDDTVQVNWTAAVDANAGLAGYSYVFDTTTNTTPDATQDIALVTTVTSSALANGNGHYFHIRAVDAAGNWGTAVHYGPFFIDATAPAGPTGASSTSHTVSTWSSDTTVDMTWTAATDANSGLAGYSYLFDTSASTDPDTTQDIGTLTTVTSSALATGNSHYFHIRPVDAAGNWGTSVHVGPFFVDVTAPTVPGTPSATTPTSDTTPSWTWTASTDANSGLAATPYSVQWSQDNTFVSGVSSDTSVTNGYTHGSALAAGTWYFRVRATDTVGNQSAYSSNGSVLIDTTAPVGPTGLTSPSHTVSAWSSDNTVQVDWTAATDASSGLAGYSYLFDTSASTTPDTTSDVGLVTTVTSSALADGNGHYFHIRAVDAAGNWGTAVHLGPFFVDVTNPPAPAGLTSPSHTLSTWSSDTTVDMNWTAVVDATSGLSGYSYLFDTSASTTPDATQDIGTVTTVTSSALATGNSHYFHIRAVDATGNWGTATHYGPFFVDVTAPAGPSISSSSPVVSTWSGDTTVQVDWTAATDANSGLSGYSYLFDTSASTTPDATQDIGTSTSVISSALADGSSHYFHIRPVDNVGNWGTAVHYGPFWIDSSMPTGGSVSYTDGWYTSLLVDVTADDGNGAISGINVATRALDRQSATLTGGTCNTYGGYSAISPSGTYPDYDDATVTSGNCYQYQYRVTDNSGNQATYNSSNVARVDNVAPTGPTGVASSSHTVSVSSSDNTVDMAWTAATDAASGLAGYSYVFDNAAGTDPDTTQDIGLVTTVSSGTLADGSWYFHIRARDAAGNWTATQHVGPFLVDTTDPVIAEDTAIAPVAVDTTPTYVFSSDEAGDVTVGGACAAYLAGADLDAEIGLNSLTFAAMPGGPYSGCTVMVTDAALNESNVLTIPNFYVYMGGSSAGGGSIPAVINLYSPNGGETLDPATAHTVYWSTSGSGIATSRVSLSVNNGSTWTVLAEELTGGSYSWTVPDVATTEAKIRVQAQDGIGFVLATDESESVFTITGTTSVEQYQEEVVPVGDADDEAFVPADETAASPTINVDKGLGENIAPANPFCESGSLIKLPSDNNPLTQMDSAVYFCGHDGKRYVFPNLPTFYTWFADFSAVVILGPDVMSQIQLGGNVTYKPGVRMLKLQTDPKVYAVDNGGVLRWVTSEAVAVGLYGADWATKVDDLSDAYATDYTYGAPIY